MIDLHCHLLPGLDDGPSDMEGALALARRAADAGVATVAATPHLRADFPAVRPLELARRCDEVRGRLNAERVALAVVVASEIDLSWAGDASDEELRLASFAQRGTDLLLETPYDALPPGFEERIFALQVRGYRILLAHPERNVAFQRRPRRLHELARRGVLLQVTGPAFQRRGTPSSRLAHALVAEGMAHVLASDAHAAEGPRSGSLAAAHRAARAIDRTRADWMVTEAPAAVLEGEPLEPPARGRRRPSLRRRAR